MTKPNVWVCFDDERGLEIRQLPSDNASVRMFAWFTDNICAAFMGVRAKENAEIFVETEQVIRTAIAYMEQVSSSPDVYHSELMTPLRNLLAKMRQP